MLSLTLEDRVGHRFKRCRGMRSDSDRYLLYMVGEEKETVEATCKIPGWVHSDSINLERESVRIIRLGAEGGKIKSSFLDRVKFEVPEGRTCGSRDVR